MAIRVAFENVSGCSTGVPAAAECRRWVKLALTGERADAELGIRIVDETESASLNAQWRQKDKPTNVLSFPLDVPEGLGVPMLGDLVICAAVVSREAREQGKPLMSHWAHMVIHGTLHLLGYDHETAGEADIMEAREKALLAHLGMGDPYA